MATGPYVKVYQSIVEDPMFERVFSNDHALATWLRMLFIADAMYPISAPMPARNLTVRLLIDCGLVIEKSGNRYSMRGLEADRERRSAAGRNAAAMRWQSNGSADPMPNKAEQNRTKQTDGQSPTMMGWRPKLTPLPGEAPNPRHEGQHPDCYVCGTTKVTP